MKLAKWVVLAVLVPAVAVGLTVEGNTYGDTVKISGQTLQLIGAGVRNKWFFNVYTLAAYTESGLCSDEAMVTRDEPKYLRIDMLRNVSADRMASTIGGGFEEHMPKDASSELRQQRETFEGYFTDELTKGTVLEFIYLPGTGTLVRQAGKTLGPPLEGAQFSQVLWDIYFGEDTCCGDLKRNVLNFCRQKKGAQ